VVWERDQREHLLSHESASGAVDDAYPLFERSGDRR
jgi:hypothetical protein